MTSWSYKSGECLTDFTESKSIAGIQSEAFSLISLNQIHLVTNLWQVDWIRAIKENESGVFFFIIKKKKKKKKKISFFKPGVWSDFPSPGGCLSIALLLREAHPIYLGFN